MNGFGKEYYRNGKIKYIGEYLDGEYNGKGKEYFQNGRVKHNGEFLKGELIKNNIMKRRKKKVNFIFQLS